jgi:hypothetical protein
MALIKLLGHLHPCLIFQGADKKQILSSSNYDLAKVIIWLIFFTIFRGGGGIAPHSQNVVTLSRTPLQSDPEGYMVSVFY